MASELTRDELVALRAHHERIRDMYSGSDFAATQDKAITVIDLALRALNTEADARLGRAVRGVLDDFGWTAKTLRDDIESNRLAETVEGCIELAIYRALREEADHG